jgi:hypothetical protein
MLGQAEVARPDLRILARAGQDLPAFYWRQWLVVAKLNGDGLLNRKPAGASPSVRMTASAATNLMITREPAFRVLSASLYSCNVVKIYDGKSDEGSQQN